MIDTDAVVAAVERLDVVDHLSGGDFGEVATYLPGRRVHGVRTSGDRIEVHVVLRLRPDLMAAAADVREAVRAVAEGADVDVFITDVVLDEDDDEAGADTDTESP